MTKQIGMFSLPRDTEGVPLPPSWASRGLLQQRAVPGQDQQPVGPGGRTRPASSPSPAARYNRGMQALKGALGYLYQLNIQYYVAVNFEGFENIIDTLGGVTIDVQMPVADDQAARARRRTTRTSTSCRASST